MDDYAKIEAESVAFANNFAQEIANGGYIKDCLPNQGVPLNLTFAQERVKIFSAMLDGEVNAES